jgi:hypothetical protein
MFDPIQNKEIDKGIRVPITTGNRKNSGPPENKRRRKRDEA